MAARMAPCLRSPPDLGRVDDQPVQHGLVEPDLLGRHRAVVELVDAVGQLGGHLRLALGPPEHEDAVEGSQRGLALAGHLRHERGPGADETGVGEVEDRPQVAEAVLDGGAGEREPGAGGDPPQLLGRLAGRVLDGLRLVEDDAGPGPLGQRVDVAHRGAVGGDDDVGAGHLRLQLVGRRPGRAVVDDDPQLGREARRLRGPVADHGGRGHHEGGTLAGGAGDVRQHGGRLAQAHVEGEAAAQLDGVEEAQPGERLGLVAAELSVEALRLGGGGVGRRLGLLEAARSPSRSRRPTPRPNGDASRPRP